MLDLVGTVEATEMPDGEIVVSAHGPLDERVAGALRDTLVPLAAADDSVILLDLGDAHGIDDVALDVISRAAHLIRRRGESLHVITRSPFVRKLVDDSGLGEIVVVSSTYREALDA